MEDPYLTKGLRDGWFMNDGFRFTRIGQRERVVRTAERFIVGKCYEVVTVEKVNNILVPEEETREFLGRLVEKYHITEQEHGNYALDDLTFEIIDENGEPRRSGVEMPVKTEEYFAEGTSQPRYREVDCATEAKRFKNYSAVLAKKIESKPKVSIQDRTLTQKEIAANIASFLPNEKGGRKMGTRRKAKRKTSKKAKRNTSKKAKRKTSRKRK